MAAAALLQRLHISRPHDLQHLEDIAWAANALVREADLEGADGRHVRSGARSVITVKRGALRSRQRFTIAHELGHLELHPDAGDLSLCTESDVSEAPLESKEARTKREGEANDFAGHLLVPTLMLTPICRGRAPSFDLVEEVVRTFDVSLTAALERYVATVNEGCVLVHSRAGRVVRFSRSRDAEELGLFIEPRRQLDPYTYAYSAFRGESISRRGEQVDASAWFEPNRRIRGDAMVREFTWPLPSFDSVLTLLWVEEDIEVDD